MGIFKFNNLKGKMTVVVEIALVFGFTSLFFLYHETVALLTLYGTRDLLRAINWWQGQPVLYGPELTGGGYAPGPFFYILNSIPLSFYPHWWGMYYFKCFLGAATGPVVWFFGKRIGGVFCAAWMLILFVSSRRIYASYTLDWNASFQLFFSFLCLIGLLMSFEKGCDKGRRLLYLTFFTIALSTQIHGSFVYFIVLFFVLQIFAKKVGWENWDIKAIFTALIWFFVPSIPFLFWLFWGNNFQFFNFSPAPPLDTYTGLLLSFRKFNFLRESNEILFSHTELGRYPFLNGIYLKYSLLVTIFVFIGMLIKTKRPVESWIKRAGLLMISATLIYSPMILSNLSLRYFYHWQVTYIVSAAIATFLICKKFFQITCPKKFIAPFKTLLSILFIFLAYWAVDTHKEYVSYRKNEVKSSIPPEQVTHDIFFSVGQGVSICRAIYERTGWGVDEIIQRVFALRIENGTDLWAICDYEIKKGNLTVSIQKEIHGFIIFKQVGTKENPELWKTWWKNQPMPKELKTALVGGRIKFEKEIMAEGMILLPYRKIDKYSLPEKLSNMGFGYREAPGETELLGLDMKENFGVIENKDESNVWFYINKCKKYQQWCRVGFHVSGDAERLSESKVLRMKILGTPLSQQVGYTHQYLALALYNVYLNIRCDEGVQKIPVVSQLGNHLEAESRTDKFFTTPYERYLKVTCSGSISSMELEIKKLRLFDTATSDKFLNERIGISLERKEKL